MQMDTAPGIDWPRVLLAACRRIEDGTDSSSLTALATAAHVSASELQRQFKRRLGVSPKAYAQALKLHRLSRGVANESSTLQAPLAPGIGGWLGLSDLGWMLLAATGRGICWLAFGDAPGALLEELRGAFPRARFRNDEPRLHEWFERVREFVLLPGEALDLPVDIQGTAFQARVWRALRRIPLGETATYGDVARRLGQASASRAVARACAGNKVALLIPCHRVLAADGRLAGYRWGMERKAEMLRREGALDEVPIKGEKALS